MSFQAYLDAIEDKTGLTPRELMVLAHERGFDEPTTKVGVVIDWLAADYGLGRGHSMALVHVLKNGASIDSRHVGSEGPHRDASAELWLDGKNNRP